VHGQAFNVGRTDENYRIRDIAEIVRETVPGSRIEYAPGAAPDQRSYRVDFGKLRRAVPEFEARWTVRDGARELYDAYRRHGLRAEDLEGPRYRRVDQIRLLLRCGEIDARLRRPVDGAPAARDVGSVG
jgi:hypothetical protein